LRRGREVRLPPSWQVWALLLAAFAARTAIFAKVGVENVGSDFATFVRTMVVLLALGVVLSVTEEWQSPSSVSGRSYAFLGHCSLMAGTESKPSDAASVRRNLSLIGDHGSLRGRHLPPHDGVGNAAS
jgi:hypothetical protein